MGAESVKVITSVDDAVATAGEELGVSRWVEVDQDRIDEFADVTMDHQWIHVDVEKAKVESPYGATLAHGFLMLSLATPVGDDTVNLTVRHTVEIDGVDKPAAVAELIARFVFQ